MYPKTIAIIPARGGSKRLINKNIYSLNGKPLIAYSIEACLKSKSIDEIYVSSDSEEILTVAAQYGAKTLIRDASLADDQTPKIIAIRGVIQQIEKAGNIFDNVAIVQANSPELTAAIIDTGFDLFESKKLWEVMSADSNGVQNGALRIIKKEVAFNEFLSAHCGFFVADLIDVHTIEDIQLLESKLK
jgi:CMP-N,N'-diacetyllegionaminic acid synthase